MKMLLEKSDENHPITVQQIIDELGEYGIEAERKSIYSDIEILNDFGFDIICEKDRANKYFIGKREFELAELKLLVDAVQSSKFITHKKSSELIKKLETLTSAHEANQLHRQVMIADQVKGLNENIYYNVDTIHKAIQENKAIRFKYFNYNINREIEYRHQGDWYYSSPYALTWADENYYMIAYHERYNDISNFRVDRMKEIEILEKPRFIPEEAKDFNVADYTKKYFRMFSGATEMVKLKMDNELVNVVIDRFGTELQMKKYDEKSFIIHVEVVCSDTFFGWLFMFGDKVKILAPQKIVEEMKELVAKVQGVYGDFMS